MRSGYWPSVNQRNIDWALANFGEAVVNSVPRDESAYMAAQRKAGESDG